MINLQLFADEAKPVKGKKLVYLFRIASKASTTQGTAIAFTTDNTRSKSKDTEKTVTKDGTQNTPGEVEQSIDVTALMKKGDTFIHELEKAMDDDELMEIWEANLEEPSTGDNKFKGKYFQGYISEMSWTSNAEDNAEVSISFEVNGKGVDGDVTVTAQQQSIADYVFRDTTQGA